MSGSPIPDDWDGVSFQCYQVLWPRSEMFEAILLGQISEPSQESYWDLNTGDTSIPAAAIAQAFRLTRKPLISLGLCQEVQMIEPTAFRSYMDTDAVISVGVPVDVDFDTLLFDRGPTGFQIGNGRHKPSASLGIWHYTVFLTLTSGVDIEAWILSDEGASGHEIAHAQSNSGELLLSADWEVTDITEQVWVQIQVTPTSILSSIPSWTYFSGHYIGLPDVITDFVEAVIASGVDDAHETKDGSVFSYTGTNLRVEPTTNPSTGYDAGCRWIGINIPQGSTITQAHVEVQFPTNTRNSPKLTMYAHADDNSSDFATVQDINGRTKTSASVIWNADDLPINEYVSSPDITALIQEVVDRPGWAGQAITILFISDIVDGEEATRFIPYDSDPLAACKIRIDWEL